MFKVETKFIKSFGINRIAPDVTIMTSFDSKILLGFQKMRTHGTMVFAWSDLTNILLHWVAGLELTLFEQMFLQRNNVYLG